MQAGIGIGCRSVGAALSAGVAEACSYRSRSSACSFFVGDSCSYVRHQSTGKPARSSLSIGNIGNSGKTEGLRARLGRLSFISRSFTSSPQQSLRGTEGGVGAESTMAPNKGLHTTADSEENAVVASSTGEEPQPVLFLSHGSPMTLVQKTPARSFLVNLPKQVKKPKAILIVSAHWDTIEPTVTSVTKNDTIYDFYGFPREFYKMSYNAPGDPELADRTVELLRAGGFPKAKVTDRRGLDHGAWVPLILMYPNLDIPIVQLSVQYRKDGSHHYKLGQALAPLKDEDILVIGSGSTTHNLRKMNPNGPLDSHAVSFDTWLNDSLVEHRDEEVINFTEKAPYAVEMHPTPDHFLPMIVALGAAGDNAECKRIHNSFELGNMSMSSWAWQTKPALSQTVPASA